MKRGRPTKGPDTFPENWKEIMYNAGREGKNNSDFLKQLGISHTTHIHLLKRNNEYKLAYDKYMQLHESWWLEQAKITLERDGAENFSTRLFMLILGNKQRQRWNRK